MNRERIIALADFLVGLEPKKYEPLTWLGLCSYTDELDGCGTTACMAGWTVYLFNGSPVHRLSVKEVARQLLGISHTNVEAMFYSPEQDPKVAAEMLYRYAETGKVVW